MSGRDGIAAAVSAGAAAAAMDLEFGLVFAIDFNGAVWRAWRRDGTGSAISALDPGDLEIRVRAAWEGNPW